MTPVRFWKSVLSLIAPALAISVLFRVWPVLIPFFIGFAIAYLVQPLLVRFEARGFRRDRIVIVLYATLVLSAALLAVIFLPVVVREARQIAEDVPRYSAAFDQMVGRFNTEVIGKLQTLVGRRAEAFRIPVRADQVLDHVLAVSPTKLLNYAHFGLWVIIIPFVAFFAMAQGKAWMNALFDLTPAPYVESLLGLFAEIDSTLGAYIRGQLMEGACVGLVTAAGLALFGFDGAVLFGIATAAMNMVPMMAPIAGGALALLLGYFQGLGTSSLIGIFFLFLLVRLLDDFIFIPFVLGSSVQLHPILILLSVLAGFEIGGFIGLVVAVPAAAVLKVILGIVFGERRLSLMLDERHIPS